MAEHQNHRARRLRLEEQARRRGLSEKAVQQRGQQYEARWTSWAERQLRAALSGLIISNGQIMSKYTYIILGLVPFKLGLCASSDMALYTLDPNSTILELDFTASGGSTIQLSPSKPRATVRFAGAFRHVRGASAVIPKYYGIHYNWEGPYLTLSTTSTTFGTSTCRVNVLTDKYTTCGSSGWSNVPEDQTVELQISRITPVLTAESSRDLTGDVITATGTISTHMYASQFATYRLTGTIKPYGLGTPDMKVNPTVINLKCSHNVPCTGQFTVTTSGYYRNGNLTMNIPRDVEIRHPDTNDWYTGVYSCTTWSSGSTKINFRVTPKVGSTSYSLPIVFTYP